MPNPTVCQLFVGTSGYSYGEWIDAGFYPEGTHSSNMLDMYTQTFGATELNYTWYQMPKAPAIERMCQKVPASFKFAAKLTRTLTHEINPTAWQKEALLYRQGISPVLESGKLLCILIQLPPYFDRTIPHRNYLAALLDELEGLPLAMEFRHRSWVNDKVFFELERRNITLVSVDEPDLPDLFPALDIITNPKLFYIRFHGKNAKGWQSGNIQQQFNYCYSPRELEHWASRIEQSMVPNAAAGCIFFNNHVRGQAPKNALNLIQVLGKKGLFKPPEHQE